MRSIAPGTGHHQHKQAAQSAAAGVDSLRWVRPLADPPSGFVVQDLHLYDSEDDSSLFTFGHVDRDRFVAAVAAYVRAVYPPWMVGDDPLAALRGGADQVRATTCYIYALPEIRPEGDGEFDAEVFVAPTTPGAVPVTYWPGAEPMPELPDEPYICGVGNGAHAVERDRALAALRAGDDMAGAACGHWVHLNLGRGAFDRAKLRHFTPCPACNWTAALAGGSEAIVRELDAVTPTADERAALARLIDDPLIVRRLCEAILAAADADPGYDLDAPEAVVQFLAAATEHAPAVLLTENCREGDHAADHPAGQPCPAQAGCLACSLPAGAWAGEWEGQLLHPIAAPCTVLTTLAERFAVTTAELAAHPAKGADQ